MRQRPDRVWIQEEWIRNTISDPVVHEIQDDGRHRYWKSITEAEGRYLCVITLADGETVHNAFFDRRFKG
jgi:hypothetical protein